MRISRSQLFLARKDMREAMSNKTVRVTMMLVPLMFVLVLPTLFTVLLIYLPEEMGDLGPMLALLPVQFSVDEAVKASYYFLMNYLFPVFFLLIPIMASSVAAGSSFAGEKERKTMETLLFSPLTVAEIFQAKVLGALLVAFAVTGVAFVAFLLVACVGSALLYGAFVLNPALWLVILLVVSPALSLLGVTVMVLASAKAHTFQEAQQYAAILIVPVMMLMMIPQLQGFFLYGPWQLLGLGAAFALLAVVCNQLAAKSFTPEKLLR